jgi:hypothetical protein
MDDRTLTALKASIAKWERNSRVTVPMNFLSGPNDCDLCILFHDKDCLGCPVMESSGQPFCIATPYGLAEKAKYKWLSDSTQNNKARAREAARAEVEFLKSLLPLKTSIPPGAPSN